MSGRCADCRHFDTSGIYSARIGREGWGSCNRTDTDDVQPNLNADSLARAYGDERTCSGAFLYVSPEFGCVQFEKVAG